MSQLPITRVINVSVTQTPSGLNSFNPNNVAFFTHEVPGGTFGSLGYKIYTNALDVATDFGSSAKTTLMATAGFAQNPNILSGGGQLIVIPMSNSVSGVTAIQHVAFSTVPTTGHYDLGYAGNYTADIAAGSNAGAVQTALRLVAGLGSVTVAGSEADGFDVTFIGVSGPASLLTVQHDTLQDTNGYDVFITPTTTTVGVTAGSAETLGAAITRTQGLVQYCGVMETATVNDQTQGNVTAAAIVIQALDLMGYFVSYTEADIQPGGTIDLLRTGGYTKSRGRYYGDSTSSGQNAMNFMAEFVFRGHSVDFSGSRTTLDMNLKQLAGLQPDPSMNNTIGGVTGEAATSGADIYVSVRGYSCVLVSGANQFWDEVYNALWLRTDLQTAAFNYLAQTNTKIPQTEEGVTGYKAALGAVLEQAITNGYVAPGEWTGSTPFGDPQTLVNNVRATGWYMYSQPVSQQSQADRAARKMPLVQVAMKEAGSGETANIIVNIQA
jgi:hypothetical protein